MKMSKLPGVCALVLAAGLGLAGCVRSLGSEPRFLPTVTQAASLQPTAAPATQATAAPAAPKATLPPQPSPTPAPPTTTPLPTHTASPMPPHEQTVKIFLIAVGDAGKSGKKIGCDDSVIGIDVPIEKTTGVLRASLQRLLAVKTETYGQSGLYNALHRSSLEIEKLYVQNGEAGIYLKGKLEMGGECDAPRVRAQLEEAALQFSTVQTVRIWINGKPIEDVLSLK